jgi:GT2 family glycosyltransferase/ADP-heptose:LPS heptosyltransferase
MKCRLIIQLARMGDVVQSLPLLERIKRLYPEDTITLLIDSPLVPLFRKLTGIDQVFGFPMEETWRIVRQANALPHFAQWQAILHPLLDQTFDQVTVLNYSRLAVVMGNLFRTSERTGYTLAENREYIQKPTAMNLLFASIQHRHYARWHLSDLYRALEFVPSYTSTGEYKEGTENERWNYNISPSISGGELKGGHKKVGLIIGTGDNKRQLSFQFYVDLLNNLLKSNDISVLLIGGSKDEKQQRQILASIDTKFHNRINPMAGKNRLDELPELLNNCDLVVGPDTGPLHLAAWCGIPTLGLYFSSASVHQTGPYSHKCHVIEVQLPCRPCKEEDICRDNECQKILTPELVSNRIIQILKNDTIINDSPIGLSQNNMVHLTANFDPWGITFPSDNPNDLDLHLGWQRVLFGRLLFPEQGTSSPNFNLPNDIRNQLIDIYQGKDVPHANPSLSILQDFLKLEDLEKRSQTGKLLLETILGQSAFTNCHSCEGRNPDKLWSIIIPVHNQSHLTQKCLDTIIQTIDCKNIEILVVDNGSTDDTAQTVDSFPMPIRRISMGSNRGFAAACNRGAQEARGEWLYFLNNDTEVQPGWLEALNQVAETYGLKTILGAKLLYPDGRIQHAGVIFDNQGLPIHVGKGNPRDDPDFSNIKSFPAVTAAAMAVSRTTFLELGGFDEEYINGYEDVDFCLRALESGMKVLYVPQIQIIHSQGSTPGRYHHDAENEYRFLNRWKDKILQHPEWFLRSLALYGHPQSSIKSYEFNHPKKLQKNIRHFLIITGEPLNYPSPVLRLLSPLNALKEQGFLDYSVLRLNNDQAGFRQQLNQISGISALIVQRMLPHNWMMEEVFEFIGRTNIPLIVETDDLVMNRFKPGSSHAIGQSQRDNLFREMIDRSSLVTVPTEVLRTMLEQWIESIPPITVGGDKGGVNSMSFLQRQESSLFPTSHVGGICPSMTDKRGVGTTFFPVPGGKTQRGVASVSPTTPVGGDIGGVAIEVLPNLIDPKIWEVHKESSHSSNGKIRMGFFGSETHSLDLAMITPAISQVLSSYSGRVELCCWGCITEELKTLDGVRYMGPYDPDYQHYAQRLPHSQVHFTLTPLLPNRFNRAKSPIKYLEFGISGIPGIYSQLEPYHQVVKPQETGIVVSDNTKDWVDAMSRLIEDDNYRQSIAQNAKQDVQNNYLLPQHLDKWEKVLTTF